MGDERQDDMPREAPHKDPAKGNPPKEDPSENAQTLAREVELELSIMEKVTEELRALSEDVGEGPASKRPATITPTVSSGHGGRVVWTGLGYCSELCFHVECFLADWAKA